MHDIEEAHNLICEDDEVAYGDSVYVGIKERDIIKNGKNLSKVEYRIVRRPKSLPWIFENSYDWDIIIEHRKFYSLQGRSTVLLSQEYVRIPKDTLSLNR